MQFRLYPLRFTFVARESIHFPAVAANLLRGAFGKILRGSGSGAYARIFAPSAMDGPPSGPSGLADRPRPFVFRATHLDGVTVPADARFHFDLNLFDMRSGAVADLEAAFGQLARAELVQVSSQSGSDPYQPLAIHLDPMPEAIDRAVVRFLTPTELKSGAQVIDLPEFGVLAARIRDRISTLRALYDGGPLDLDFRGFGQRAARVRMTRRQTRWVERQRRRAGNGRIHPLGGFVGEVEYEGDLREFWPYLEAARFAGVGRQTVWGKGEISTSRGAGALDQ